MTLRRHMITGATVLVVAASVATADTTPASALPIDAAAIQACADNSRAQTELTADKPAVMGAVAETARQSTTWQVRAAGTTLHNQVTAAQDGGQLAIDALVLASWRLHQVCVSIGLAPATGG